ncbi:MAG: hypothetical protein ACLGIM_10435, partial [Alphaproteobacteria bacterium]
AEQIVRFAGWGGKGNGCGPDFPVRSPNLLHVRADPSASLGALADCSLRNAMGSAYFPNALAGFQIVALDRDPISLCGHNASGAQSKVRTTIAH